MRGWTAATAWWCAAPRPRAACARPSSTRSSTGSSPIVPREAVGDRWADAHAQSLHDMEKKYADVLPLSGVLDGLREAAGAVDEAR